MFMLCCELLKMFLIRCLCCVVNYLKCFLLDVYVVLGTTQVNEVQVQGNKLHRKEIKEVQVQGNKLHRRKLMKRSTRK